VDAASEGLVGGEKGERGKKGGKKRRLRPQNLEPFDVIITN